MSGELSSQGNVLRQGEFSAPKVSQKGPGESSPEAFGRGFQPRGLVPRKLCVFPITALGRCIQVICVPVSHLL